MTYHRHSPTFNPTYLLLPFQACVMAAVYEVIVLVDHRRWAIGRRKDGSKYPYKVEDCHRVACKYSTDYGKEACDCQV